MENHNNRKESLAILGLNQNATQAEIKKKYRKLAKIFHPDINSKNPQASKEFIKIKKAYDELMINIPKKIQITVAPPPKQPNIDNIFNLFLRMFRKDFKVDNLNLNNSFIEPPEPFLDLREIIRKRRENKLF